MIDNLNTQDIQMWHLLNALKEQSKCIDKQVACVITNKDGLVLATGVNRVLECDKNCHDKTNRVCDVIHAEVEAVAHMNTVHRSRKLIAYVNLFPCVPCQELLDRYVDQIVSFGFVHKKPISQKLRVVPDVSADLIEHDGEDVQLSVVQGELAELITAISDYFHRPDKKMTVGEMLDEIVDCELMLENLKRIIWSARAPETYNLLRKIRGEKLANLLMRIQSKS